MDDKSILIQCDEMTKNMMGELQGEMIESLKYDSWSYWKNQTNGEKNKWLKKRTWWFFRRQWRISRDDWNY